MRVFEIRMLRLIFRPKRQEVTGVWRNLRNEDLHNSRSLPNIGRITKSSSIRWTEHVARMEGMRNIEVLVGKFEGKIIWKT